MTFGQFMSILRARWMVALAVLALTVLATLVVSLSLPKQYKATASVVVDYRPDPLTTALYGGMGSPALMATQVDIIQSERVAQRVVRNLKLAQNPQVRQQWQDETKGVGNIETWLSGLFQRNMEASPSRESTVISISYRAPDPRFAAALANAFVQAYIDTSLELRVDPARMYSSFFDSRSKDAREALERAQGRLSAFQRNNGIIATDERLDVENARLGELSSQLTVLQALTAESGSRDVQAQGSQADRLQEVLNNPVVGALKSDITRGEGRLQELSTRYGENHPLVQEAKANLAELRLRLDQETRRVTSGVGVSNTINRQRQAEVRASLEAQRTKLLKLKAVRDEGQVLLRDVENAQRAYDAVQQRFTQTSLESQTTQSNVNALTQAEPPLAPSSPRVTLNTLVAFAIGLVLAAAAALALEMRDRRVRTIDDVVATLSLPVLVALPRPGSRRARTEPESLLQQRLMAPLAATGRGA